MVPSKLKRHFKSKLAFQMDKKLAYFKRAQDLNQMQQDCLLDCVRVCDKAIKASYMLAQLIAKQKKPVVETLILPVCKKLQGSY